ncbi:IgA FC receptor [Micromonospora sp. MH99]|nr:IgA FC receptor [Micromonospora sp. MH99]
MIDPLESLIRSTLTDLAEEAPIVHDQLNRAERRVRNRRRATVTMGAVGTLAAILIAAPIALAASGSDGPPPAVPSPAGPAAVPDPSNAPPGVPSRPNPPATGPLPAISNEPGPPGVPGRPDQPAPPGVPGQPGQPGPNTGGAPGVPAPPTSPTIKPSPSGPIAVPSPAR